MGRATPVPVTFFNRHNPDRRAVIWIERTPGWSASELAEHAVREARRLLGHPRLHLLQIEPPIEWARIPGGAVVYQTQKPVAYDLNCTVPSEEYRRRWTP